MSRLRLIRSERITAIATKPNVINNSRQDVMAQLLVATRLIEPNSWLGHLAA